MMSLTNKYLEKKNVVFINSISFQLSYGYFVLTFFNLQFPI